LGRGWPGGLGSRAVVARPATPSAPGTPIRRLRRLLLGLRSGRLWLLLRLGLALRAPLAAAAPARTARLGLRRRKVLRQRGGDLRERRDALPGRVDELVRARGIALGRGEERCAHLYGLLERRV